MQVAGLTLAIHVVLNGKSFICAFANVHDVGIGVDVFDQPEPCLSSGWAEVFFGSQPFLTPVTMANVNMPVPELSAHDSGLSSNCRHRPSSP